MSSVERREADVAVVGAGISGLTAARRLAAANLDVVVLEGRNRVGGRTAAAALGDGKTIELGGQFVGATHERIADLLEELRIGTFPTHDNGRRLLELDGRVRSYRGAIPRLAPTALVRMGIVEAKLDRMARAVSLHAPWAAAGAARLDALTLGAWLDRNAPGGESRRLLDTAIGAVWGAEPAEVNLLQALAYIAAAGGLRRTTGVDGGMQARRIVGGPTRLCATLAADAGELRLGTTVRAIDTRHGHVELRADNLTVRADRAVVALPPALAVQIAFEPLLPADRDRALRRLPAGRVTKIALVYSEPFWRAEGFSGQAASTTGPICATFDNSPPDAQPGILTGFVTGRRAAALAALPGRERRLLVTAQAARLFGPRAKRPDQYLEHDWAADPYARGCYFGLAAPGAVGEIRDLLSTPLGRIHWAGAETTPEGYGGMDGAVRAGDRAADEVIVACGRDRTAGARLVPLSVSESAAP